MLEFSVTTGDFNEFSGYLFFIVIQMIICIYITLANPSIKYMTMKNFKSKFSIEIYVPNCSSLINQGLRKRSSKSK